MTFGVDQLVADLLAAAHDAGDAHSGVAVEAVLHGVWPPTADLSAHDHLMWAAIGLYGGREDNRVFRTLPDGGLEHRRTTTMLGGDTILLGDDAVHAVANPSREWTGAIHVYDAAAPFDIGLLTDVLDSAARRARHLHAESPPR